MAFLRNLGVEPKKGLSQNFLIDGNIVAKIIHEAQISEGDAVLEIGPGPGALTEVLHNLKAEVYAVEKDAVFAEALKRFSPKEVFCEDILKFDLSLVPKNSKVVSNLPYHLTAPILTLLAPRHDLFSTVTVMVQEEVARKMTAQVASQDYGYLSVFLHFYSEPVYAFKVSKHCFYPQPKVDSAIVTLKLKKPSIDDAEGFLHFVRRAFQHRRKMIKTTLGPQVGILLEQLGLNPKARPEELSLEIFIKLYLNYKI